MAGSLIGFLTASAARRPSHVVVEDLPDGALTYAALDDLSSRVRDRLRHLGVRKGDRVGVCLRKSIDAYAAILGVMKAGAAYVPIDSSAPAPRAAFITHDCAMKAVVIETSVASRWRDGTAALGAVPAFIDVSDPGGGRGLRAALDRLDAEHVCEAGSDELLTGGDLAYILYTSGSTGDPKGVMLSHRSATSYVDWCSEVFSPSEGDRFSSHAPFHFDLSILDLYVPLKHGATVVLIDAERGKEPMGLAALIASRRLTVWYSTPTVLAVLAQFGKMSQHDYSALRLVLFAGEVFPVKHLRAVKTSLPQARFVNLYGPTETNVCTWHGIPEVIEEGRTEPYPIGRTCSHFQARVVDEAGRDVERGSEGELVVHGAGTMIGYWDRPERTAQAFLIDPDGRRWYRTGDIVIEAAGGVFSFVGRRDRMVKRRGYRIELGEIEASFYRHAAVREAAVVAVEDGDGGVRIKAYLALANGHARSEIQMRGFCAQALPAYMIPDAFEFVDRLPKTSTDKVDYQQLVRTA